MVLDLIKYTHQESRKKLITVQKVMLVDIFFTIVYTFFLKSANNITSSIDIVKVVKHKGMKQNLLVLHYIIYIITNEEVIII